MPNRLALLAAFVFAAVAGFFAGGVTKGLGLFASDEVPAAAPARAAVPAAAPASADEATLKAVDARVEAESLRRELLSQVADLTMKLRQAQQSLADARAHTAGTASAANGPAFVFGEMGTLAAVHEADWREMADASKTITAGLLEILKKTEAGETVPKETYFRLQENTERVRKYEYRTIDKIPTSAKHNGELTHPISVANLIAATLSQGGASLSDSQTAEIERLGAAFDKDFVALRAGWVAGVPRVKRMLEEYRLKGRFTDGLWAALTPEQRALWIDPAFRGIAGIDLYDPTLMIVHTSIVVTGEAAADIRTKLLALVRKSLSLAADAASPVIDRLVDAFLARLSPSLEPVPKSRASKYTYAQGLAAGEATVDLVEALLRDVELAPAARDALLDDYAWYVPRLVKAS